MKRRRDSFRTKRSEKKGEEERKRERLRRGEGGDEDDGVGRWGERHSWGKGGEEKEVAGKKERASTALLT